MNMHILLIAVSYQNNWDPAKSIDFLENDEAPNDESFNWAIAHQDEFINFTNTEFPSMLKMLPTIPLVIHKSALKLFPLIEDYQSQELENLMERLKEKISFLGGKSYDA